MIGKYCPNITQKSKGHSCFVIFFVITENCPVFSTNITLNSFSNQNIFNEFKIWKYFIFLATGTKVSLDLMSFSTFRRQHADKSDRNLAIADRLDSSYSFKVSDEMRILSNFRFLAWKVELKAVKGTPLNNESKKSWKVRAFEFWMTI